MLSRTADHLFWLSRYTERAGECRGHSRGGLTTARSACHVLTTTPGKRAALSVFDAEA
ncbi:alpha-E domain-containing protein [Ramlibacter sp.]|uniref:alpha-E domain-containing protein n=1 Tax=Ramlibacter sp. TaxID=1917967 RepID=UPI002CC2DE79|nr:alpha-E domain-containing protein [Ramlibacter sp.]HWI83789.1 alpha-E domain-containing protein [Ramlibacter sp.]